MDLEEKLSEATQEDRSLWDIPIIPERTVEMDLDAIERDFTLDDHVAFHHHATITRFRAVDPHEYHVAIKTAIHIDCPICIQKLIVYGAATLGLADPAIAAAQHVALIMHAYRYKSRRIFDMLIKLADHAAISQCRLPDPHTREFMFNVAGDSLESVFNMPQASFMDYQDPTTTDARSFTRPVMIAMKHRRHEMLTALLVEGSTANVFDGKGRTALGYAIRQNDLVSVAILLYYGANPEYYLTGDQFVTRSYLEVTPLDIAVSTNNRIAVALLLAHGADHRHVAPGRRTTGELAHALGRMALHDLIMRPAAVNNKLFQHLRYPASGFDVHHFMEFDIPGFVEQTKLCITKAFSM